MFAIQKDEQLPFAKEIEELQSKIIKELYQKHHINDLVKSCFEDLTKFAKENPFKNEYDFAFYYDDENMQKYYLDDFDAAVNLLVIEFKKEGFRVNVELDCGKRIVYLKWD